MGKDTTKKHLDIKMNNKSSLEWLVQMYASAFGNELNSVMSSIIERAKEMHKQEIIDAFNQNINGFNRIEMEETGENWAENYYNKTYESNN